MLDKIDFCETYTSEIISEKILKIKRKENHYGKNIYRKTTK